MGCQRCLTEQVSEREAHLYGVHSDFEPYIQAVLRCLHLTEQGKVDCYLAASRQSGHAEKDA